MGVFQTGPIQGFENIEYYDAKKIKDRLNNGIINEYLKKLKLEIWSDEFYKSNKWGVYFEQLSWEKGKNESTIMAIPHSITAKIESLEVEERIKNLVLKRLENVK